MRLQERWHVLDAIMTAIGHHRIATVLGILAIVGVIYQLNRPPQIQRHAGSPFGQEQAFETPGPLTRLEDPLYTQEYPKRAEYLNKHLEKLRNDTGADRAYVLSYQYAAQQPDMKPDVTISKTFEAAREGLAPSVRNYQNAARTEWLKLKAEERIAKGASPVFPYSYGLEIYDERNRPVGYLGIDYERGDQLFQPQTLVTIREAISPVKSGLLSPLNTLE